MYWKRLYEFLKPMLTNNATAQTKTDMEVPTEIGYRKNITQI